MKRSQSVPSQEVTLHLPQEAMREYRGKFANKRGEEPDPLGNGPVESPLARAAIKELARKLDVGENFAVQGDGSLKESE